MAQTNRPERVSRTDLVITDRRPSNMLLSFVLVIFIGFAAHRASLCTVRAVMQWMGVARTLRIDLLTQKDTSSSKLGPASMLEILRKPAIELAARLLPPVW